MSLPPFDSSSLPPPNLKLEPLPAAPAPVKMEAPPPSVPQAAVLKPYEPELKASDWLGLIKDAATYPLRKDGWYILIPGAVLGLAWVIGSMFGTLVSSFPLVFGFAYFSAFYLSVLESTITGKDEVPDWPPLSNMGQDFVMPFFVVLTAFLLGGLPSLVLSLLLQALQGSTLDPSTMMALDDNTSTIIQILNVVMVLIGQAYVPMALLSHASNGGFASIFPQHVLPAIIRCGGGYLALVGLLGAGALLAGSSVVWYFSQDMVISLLVHPLVGLLVAVLQFYWLLVHGRMVGLFYRRYQYQLEW